MGIPVITEANKNKELLLQIDSIEPDTKGQSLADISLSSNDSLSRSRRRWRLVKIISKVNANFQGRSKKLIFFQALSVLLSMILTGILIYWLVQLKSPLPELNSSSSSRSPLSLSSSWSSSSSPSPSKSLSPSPPVLPWPANEAPAPSWIPLSTPKPWWSASIIETKPPYAPPPPPYTSGNLPILTDDYAYYGSYDEPISFKDPFFASIESVEPEEVEAKEVSVEAMKMGPESDDDFSRGDRGDTFAVDDEIEEDPLMDFPPIKPIEMLKTFIQDVFQGLVIRSGLPNKSPSIF